VGSLSAVVQGMAMCQTDSSDGSSLLVIDLPSGEVRFCSTSYPPCRSNRISGDNCQGISTMGIRRVDPAMHTASVPLMVLHRLLRASRSVGGPR
jgi:hypothetical protein